jgi:hypothetical protein
MMLRLTLICFFILSFLECSSQKVGTKEFIFEWIPNPTDFILHNHKKYLSNDEYKRLLNCYALAFDADVDLYNTKIVSIKYSEVSTKLNNITKSPDLDADIARKVEKVLLDNIGVSDVKRISVVDSIPKGVYRYVITLDFNEKDRRRAKKLK